MSSSTDEHTSVPSDSRKGAWTAKEDQCLQARVGKYGTKSWTTIASGVEGRSAKSCRLRWYNQLCPGVKRTPFSEWEQAVIIKAQKVHTNKWAALAKLLKGRTDNAIKNHWNATLSRKLNNPAENFRNQYIERNVTLEWLLQHPELDSSNDIEEALAGTFGSSKASKLGLGVIKPLKKKKRRSTPSSPSYSLSPSPPPPCRSSKSQRQAAALEACCESGLSSETAPAASKRAAVAAAAAAAANAAAAAGGGGCSYNLNQQYGAVVAGGQQHSGCYSPCSQTRSPPAMHAQQQQQQQQQLLSMHCTGCMPGPGGMCSCGVWMGPPQQQQQQQQQYHSSNAALERTTTASSYLSCQDGQLSNMLWEQPPQQQQQQQQLGGDFGSSYGAPQDFHGSNFQALPVQQQQQQQMFLKAEPQFSSPMQDAMVHSPVKQEQQQSLLLPPEQQQQQHSSSSMSSGSPVGVAAGVPDRSHSSTDLPAAAGGSAAAASGLRIQTDAAANTCSSLLAGLPPAASSRTSISISAAAAAAGPPDAQAGGGPAPHGAWKPNCNLTGGMHLPPSDCLGPLGIRPLGQGKILSPAAYDMMVAGVSRPGMEVQLRSENGSVHAAAAAAAAGERGQVQGASLQQHHSVPPPSMMSAVPNMMGSGSSRGLSPHHPLGRSHSYSCGPSHYDGSSNSFNPPSGLPHFSSSGGCYPGSEFGPNGPGSSSSMGGPGGSSHHMGVQGSGYGPEPLGPYSSSGLGSFPNASLMGSEAAAYAASNAACARAGSGRSNMDLPPVSRCHSTPSPYNNAGGGSSGGGYPQAPWQQQQQQMGLPPRSSYPMSAGGSYESNMAGLPPSGHSHIRHHSYGGAHNPAAAVPYGSSSADPLLNMPASLLADAPATVMLQQAVASGAAAAAAAAGGSSSDLHMGLLKDMSAAGPHLPHFQQQQHLAHAHTAPALSSLGGPADHLQQQQQQQRSATPPLTAWDAVGETLSTAFGDAGDDSLVWDNFDLPDLKENDVEALLML